jgi:hypothetical protein
MTSPGEPTEKARLCSWDGVLDKFLHELSTALNEEADNRGGLKRAVTFMRNDSIAGTDKYGAAIRALELHANNMADRSDAGEKEVVRTRHRRVLRDAEIDL